MGLDVIKEANKITKSVDKFKKKGDDEGGETDETPREFTTS